MLVTFLVVHLAQPAAAAEQIGPNLTEIKAPQAWARGKGRNVSVAIVSSGIGEHEDLAGKVGAGFDVSGSAGDPRADASGRGTHLAGIVGAAMGNGIGIAGVAPDAKVLPYKAFDSESATGNGYAEALARARSVKPTVVLVDVPAGYTGFPDLRDGMKKLADAGISVVVGAQDGLSVDDLPVLAVAATGTGTSPVGPRGVAAPGGNILSTKLTPALLPTDPPISEYEARSGTGQAAAHVAGAVAILRGIGANPTQAADFLRSTARKGDPSLGAGSIDVAAAATAFKTPPPTTTTTKAKPETPSTTAPATGTGFGTVPPTGPAALSGESDGLGTDEPAVVPPGADELSQSETGGPSILIGGKERPWGMLTVGFGLLFGVGTALSITFRRLADAAI